MEMLSSCRWGWIALGVLSGGLGACHLSTQAEEPPPAPIVVPTPEPGLSVYARAGTADELMSVLRVDLDRHQAARAFDGLEAFVFGALVAREATHADLMLKEVRPVLLFQHHGGTEYIGSTKELQAILATEAARELEALYAALKHRDMGAIEAARSTERGLLHPDMIRRSSSLAAHAQFFEGVLAYAALKAATAPGVEQAQAVVSTLKRARDPFAGIGQDEPFFLTLVLSAEALELVDEDLDAMEFWIQAAESKFWSSAPHDLQVAIRGRILSYRETLRAEVEAEVLDDWTERLKKIEDSAKLEYAALEVKRRQELEQATATITKLEGQILELEEQRLKAEREQELNALTAQIDVLQAQLGEARRAHDQYATAGSPASPGSVFVTWQSSP